MLVLGLLLLVSSSALTPEFTSLLDSLEERLPTEPHLLCDTCKMGVEVIQDTFLHGTLLQDAVIDLIVEVCELKKIPKAMCTGLIPAFAQVVIPSFGNSYLDPEFLCYKALLCASPQYVDKNITQMVENIMLDAPEVLPLPTPGTKTYRFLHVSDIHVDLLYDAGSAMHCPYESCCRFSLGTTNVTSEMAGYWGALSNCDPPVRTVEAFLKQAATLDLDFVLWTGDNPSADYWLYNRETHLQNSQVLTDLFKQYLGDTPVYPIMGNHACYPQDQFHVFNEQWLTGGLADIWSVYLTPEAQATFADNAYYSMKDNNTGLRIIGVNTQMCDNLNLWLMLNDTDPGNHLEWIRQELYKAEANGEYVLIIGHIPMGDRFCSSTWSTVYQAISNRFRNIIRGQFFGHTHVDQFQLVNSLSAGLPAAGVLYVVPSLTTHVGHNPAFRVFEMDTETLQIVDYHNYRLDLTQANQNTNDMPMFDFAYAAKEEYGLRDLSPASWQWLADNLQAGNQTLMAKYWKNFGNVLPSPGPCDETCQKTMWCGTQTMIFDDVVNCTGFTSGQKTFWMLEELAGPWRVRID